MCKLLCLAFWETGGNLRLTDICPHRAHVLVGLKKTVKDDKDLKRQSRCREGRSMGTGAAEQSGHSWRLSHLLWVTWSWEASCQVTFVLVLRESFRISKLEGLSVSTGLRTCLKLQHTPLDLDCNLL